MKPFRRRIADSASGPATYLAAGATVRGTLTGDGAYVIRGTVDGDCDVAGPVTLAREGKWLGTLQADNVIIAGTVDGDVIARERVELAETARVTGSIAGHSIAIAEGAIIEGELKVASGGTTTTFKEKRSTTPGA